MKVADMTPRQLLELWTQMAVMANAVNRQRRLKAHGARALKRRAKRRRSEAKLLRDRRRGFRAFGEAEKLGRLGVLKREKKRALARERRAAQS